MLVSLTSQCSLAVHRMLMPSAINNDKHGCALSDFLFALLPDLSWLQIYVCACFASLCNRQTGRRRDLVAFSNRSGWLHLACIKQRGNVYGGPLFGIRGMSITPTLSHASISSITKHAFAPPHRNLVQKKGQTRGMALIHRWALQWCTSASVSSLLKGP